MLRAAISKLSKHTFTYAATEQISRLATIVLIPLTTDTDYLSTADFGAKELIAKTLAFLAQLAGFNIVAAMSRFYFENQDEAHRRRVISTTVLSVLFAACALACALALGARPLGHLLLTRGDPRGTQIVLIALCIFVFQMLREGLNKVLQTQERSLLFGTLAISKLLCEIGLQIYFLVHLHAGLAGLLSAILITEGSFACLLALILLPRVGLAFSTAVFAALFGYALPLIPNGVLQFMLHSADSYILQSIRGLDAVAMYGLAYKLGYLPNFLVLGPFLLIWYPYVFSLADEVKQRELCGRFSPYLMLVMTAVAFVVALFASEIIHTMAGKPAYYQAWIAVPLVSLGYWFWGLFQLIQTGFFVVKKTKALPLLTLSAVLVNLFLNLVLIPIYGFQGAAIATVITFAVLAFATERQVQAVFAVDYPWRRIFTPALAAAGITVALLFLPPALETWSLALKLGAFVAWVIWVWLGGFFDRHERQAIVSGVSKFARRSR